MSTFDPYPQKRLACFACRDKKLRCSTIQDEVCQRCKVRGLQCVRPQSKRETSKQSHKRPSIRSSANKQRNYNGASQPRTVSPSVSVSMAILSSSDRPINADQQDLLPIESAEHLFWSTLESKKNVRDRFSFSSLPDQTSALDPILCGILTLQQAQDLFTQFHQTFGRTLSYFDQKLATFSYIRSRSHALLSVICRTIARVQKGLEGLSTLLGNHVHHVVLPALFLQSFKSVEIVQALLMLAAFEPPSDNIREDRSWTLLSHASRIASEINLQAAFESDDQDSDKSEIVKREKRNSQRVWINLWLHEFSLAQHTGRKSILAEQDLFSVCKKWHRHPLACDTDTALVSMVGLRTIIKRNRQLFYKMPPNGELFYVEQCKSDLDSWSRSWCASEVSFSSMPRLELASLYVSHAMVQLLGLALHNIPASQWMSTMIVDLYESCSTYLDVFPTLLPPIKLVYCYNSMFVAASYELVVAIRLIQLASRFTFIDVHQMRARCEGVWKCLAEAANLSTKDTAANCYAQFLEGVLNATSSTEQHEGQISGKKDGSGTFLQDLSDGMGATNTTLNSPSRMLNDGNVSMATQNFSSTNSTLGFDDLQFFAWAGASLAQSDDFFSQLFVDQR